VDHARHLVAAALQQVPQLLELDLVDLDVHGASSPATFSLPRPPVSEQVRGPRRRGRVRGVETRRLGRLEHRSSVLIYGAAALGEVTPEVAEASLDRALTAGINHFDVAASYGEAELRMGPWVPRVRDRIFLASKTGDRGAAGARASIEASLAKLQTSSLDLLQLHSVGDLDELDLVTAKGGALEAAVQAQQEGLAGAVGITGHGHTAPATHLEALRRFPFATVMTPLNPRLWQDLDYRRDYEAPVS
jgi:aryl-alcohol dehydrogenase-like predicted oxidoreductase